MVATKAGTLMTTIQNACHRPMIRPVPSATRISTTELVCSRSLATIAITTPHR